MLVARDDPLDTFLVTHPEALLGAPVEANVFDPGNPYVVAPHLCAAAQEIPLTEDDFGIFGGDVEAIVASLVEAGYLRKRTARLVLDPPRPGGRPRRHPVDRRQPGADRRGLDRSAGRDGRRVVGARRPCTPARSTCTSGRPTWSRRSTTRRASPSSRRADLDYSTSARDLTDITILGTHVTAAVGRRDG